MLPLVAVASRIRVAVAVGVLEGLGVGVAIGVLVGNGVLVAANVVLVGLGKPSSVLTTEVIPTVSELLTASVSDPVFVMDSV